MNLPQHAIYGNGWRTQLQHWKHHLWPPIQWTVLRDHAGTMLDVRVMGFGVVLFFDK